MDAVITQLAGLTAALDAAAAESPRGVAVQWLTSPNDRLRIAGIGLAAGSELAEHDNPGDAVLQVLSGAVTVFASGDEVDVLADEILELPHARHRVVALGPSTLLLIQVVRDSVA